ncbi:MAG: hypothetical protein KC478_16065 [Bacteriovoracaceae bacterium]|nr:hypothetical protein [Bacteriovoracaceae bacterium]
MLSFKAFFFALFIGLNSHAYFLDHFKVQHAGEIGEIAMGFGKIFNKTYSLDFMHGLVREETGGTTIETIALKNNFNLYRFNIDYSYVDLYAGLAAFHVTGLKYQARRHNSYPGSYYQIGSIRGLFYLGAKAAVDKNNKHEAYFEAGVNDVWLEAYVNNTEVMNIFEYASLALGYAYLF